MMCNCVYNKYGYVVIPYKKGFIVHNTAKPFQEGHTHVYLYKEAKRIVHHAYRRTIPECYNARFIESLIRVSNNAHFIEKLKAIKADLGDYKGYNRKPNKEEKCWKRNPRRI